MKIFKILFFCFLIVLSSCQTSSYSIVSPQRLGVDFTKGRWLLNVIDCPEPNKNQLTINATKFFKKNLKDRIFYIKDVSGLLIMPKTKLNPNKIKLKELKDGTEFDFFINIVVKKNRSDLGSIGFYESKYPSNGKNESEAFLEIYDLNLLQIIYSSHVIGSAKEDQPSVFDTKKSDKLIDNISFHKSSNRLMLGSLKKILKDLKKKSIKIPKT
jgi:hypothetical protein